MYIGIDIGGTKTLVAALSDNGVIAASVKFATPKNYDEFLKELKRVLQDELPFSDFRAGSVAAPGAIDRKRGRFEEGGNLTWRNVPLQHDIEHLTHCPMLVENDANLAGLSEAMLLKDTHAKVLYITISTGIGTGFIVNQQIDPSMADSEGGQLMLQHGDKIVKWESFASGKAIYERNALKEAIAQDVENGSHYYTIAYTPSNHNEVGRERKIEIRSTSGGCNLAYRRSYFEDNPKQLRVAEKPSSGDPLRPLMDRGMPSFTELRYRMRVAPATPQPGPDAPHAGDNAELFGPYTRYTVNFSLSTEGLTLVQGPDGIRRGTIEVALVAYSQEGKPLDWEVRSIGLAIRPEQNAVAESSGIPFHFDIDAPPGDVYLRTGIYDSSSSRVGTLEVPLSAVTVAQR